MANANNFLHNTKENDLMSNVRTETDHMQSSKTENKK